MSTLDPIADSIHIEDVKQWRGQDVVVAGGDKLGKLEEVYYDTETDAPAFGAVKSGVVSKHITLVPLTGCVAGQAYLKVTVSKEQFKNAPSIDTDVELTPEDEAAAYGHFGFEYRAAGAGARRLAKH